jgi:anti-sigma B factor antagonist
MQGSFDRVAWWLGPRVWSSQDVIDLRDDEFVSALTSIPKLDVRQVVRDDAVVLEVLGEIDLANAAQLQASFDHVLRDEQTVLVIDLGGVTFLGSIALSVLLETHGRAGPGGMRVASLSSAARRVIEVSALDQVLSIYPTVELALGADIVER